MSLQSIDRFIDLKSWGAHREAETVLAVLRADFAGPVQVGRPFEFVPLPERRHPKPRARKSVARQRLAVEALFAAVPMEEVSRVLGYSQSTSLRHNWGNFVPLRYEAYLRDFMAAWPRLSTARDLLSKDHSLNAVSKLLGMAKTELSEQLKEFRMGNYDVV